jgi:DNA-binding response OmpR family regulator
MMAVRRILVVEDDVPTRSAITMALREEGYEVAVASDRSRACDLVRREQADLLVTDLATPRLDSLKLIEERRDAHPELPVLVITSAVANGARQAQLLGADGYVEKPVRLDDLLARVASILSMRS